LENGIKAKLNEFDEKLDSHHDKINTLFMAITGDISDPDKPGLKAQVAVMYSLVHELKEESRKDHDILLETANAVKAIGGKLDVKRKRSAILYAVVATQAVALGFKFVLGG